MVQCSFCGTEIGDKYFCDVCGAEQPRYSSETGKSLRGGGGTTESSGELDKTTENIAKPQFKESMKLFGGAVNSLLQGGPQALVMHLAMEGLSKIFEIFAPVIEILQSPLEVITGIMQMSLVPLIQQLAPLVGQFNSMLMENKEGVLAIIMVLNPWMILLQYLPIIMEKNKDVFSELIVVSGELLEIFGELVTELLADEDVMFVIITTAQGLAVVLGGVVDALIYLKGVLKEVKEFIEGIKSGSGGGGGGGSDFNPAPLWNFPGIQEGGLVTAPTLAMVGEAGPELVLPLDKLSSGNEKTEYQNEQILDRLDRLVKIGEEGKRTIY